MSDASTPPPPLPSRKADPAAAEWHKFQREQRQQAPARLEDAAKFLSGMISISLTVFLSIDKEALTAWADSSVIAAAVVLWLLSLLAAFMTLFPVPFRYNQHSAEDIQRMNDRVTKYKYRWLIGSALCFVVALALVAGVFLWG